MDNLEKIKPEYKLCQSFVSLMFLTLAGFFNSLLVFFSLRESKRYWGVVYDSVSKQPLDPVIVKLMYIDGSEVETKVTDMDGRYGFLARPGKFKIFARKTNYLFPSQKATGSADGIFENLYHGEFFALSGSSEVIAPNIPMDPAAKDWNQQEKKKRVNTYPYLQFLIKRLAAVFFWFGFVLVIISLFKTYPNVPEAVYIFMGFYAGLAILSGILPEPRLWGKLKIKLKKQSLNTVVLELRNEKFPEIGFDKTRVRDDGKFLLRARPGRYFLLASESVEGKPLRLLAKTLVRVGDGGVINQSFLLQDS